MRAIVTGSHGFIGRNLTRSLRASGAEVIEFDVLIGRDMFQAWPEADIVYHLACVNQEAALRDPVGNLEVNAYGAKFAAIQSQAMNAKLVYTSTASVYGNSNTIPTPVSADIAPKTDYAVAKLAGEYFVKNNAENYEILRLSNVYGPFQTLDNPYCGVIGRFITQALDEKPLTIIEPGTQTRDFSYVGDVVDILVNELSYDNRTQNISSGVETSPNEIKDALSTLFKTEIESVLIPARPIDGIDRRKLITNYRCNTSLNEGLSATLDWFNESRREKSSGRA